MSDSAIVLDRVAAVLCARRSLAHPTSIMQNQIRRTGKELDTRPQQSRRAIRLQRMPSFEKNFPTQGDLAREQLRRRGIPYFMDVAAEVDRRLEKLGPECRSAFAASCAERLLRAHEALPVSRRQPFTLTWRPVLNAIWSGLMSGDAPARTLVQDALERFHASPYDHRDGQEGPPDADEGAAAATIFAAECYLDGGAPVAAWAARRAVDAAFAAADEELQLDPNDFEWDPSANPMPLAREAMHPKVQGELQRQLADISRLEREGIASSVVHALRG